MRNLLSKLGAITLLVAFFATTSGWVLHSHYCPVSEKQVFSLLDNGLCEMPEVTLPASCCSKPEVLPMPACGTDESCCQDIQILLELESPYSLPDVDQYTAGGIASLAIPNLASTTLVQPDFMARWAASPDPPPLRRSLDRLNWLQVYRS